MLSEPEPNRSGSNREEEDTKENSRKRGGAHLDNDVPGSAGHRDGKKRRKI